MACPMRNGESKEARAVGDGHLLIRWVKQAMARGFTLIEMLVVMAILATLLAIAAPRYFDSVERAKEAALLSNLRLLRDAIDRFQSDRNRYPESLQQLVAERYLRNIPRDAVTDSADTWITIPPPGSNGGAIYDVHSGAVSVARDGSSYANW